MKHHTTYLCGTPSGWQAYDLAKPPGTPGTDEAGAPHVIEDLEPKTLLRHLESLTEQGRSATHRLVIGVPSAWCLCGEASTEGLPRGGAAQTDQALGYRLENLLPITAEECAIGFLGTQTDRLGIALPATRLKAMIHALEDAGHAVEAIVPRAFLAAQGWLGSFSDALCAKPTTLYWIETYGQDTAGSSQLLHLDPDRPARWRAFGRSVLALSEQLALDEIETNAPRRWCEAPSSSEATTLTNLRIGQSEIEPLGNPIQAELEGARQVVQQPQQAWVNLNRGPLAPRHQWRRLRTPASACLAAAAVLMLSVTAVLHLRAGQFDRAADGFDAQAVEAFAQALPNDAVPPSPQRRLTTRLKQLRGEQGLAAGDASLASTTPVLDLMHASLAALPTERRFAITDLRLEGDTLRLTGHARSHGEADQIADALRKNTGYVVEPPSTDNLPDGGVRFTLQARYTDQAPQVDPDRPTPRSDPRPSLADRSAEGA